MAPHKVPTHLDAPDGIGAFSLRQLGLLGAGAWTSWQVLGLVPHVGPSLGDLIRASSPHLGLAAGSLPAAPIAATLSTAGPFVALALPLDPPIEHGAGACLAWLRQRGLRGPAEVAQLLGSPELDTDERRCVSAFGWHAAWELPSTNLRLADGTAVEIAQDLWGQFLDGASCSVQTLTRAHRVDAEQVVGAIARYDGGARPLQHIAPPVQDIFPTPRGPVANPIEHARSLARWLRAEVVGRNLIERRHYLAICAPDEQTFADSVQQVDEGLSMLGFRADLVRRLVGHELAHTIHRTWSPRPLRERRDSLGPDGAWTVDARQLQSDGEWHEVLALGRWPRVIRDNALAPFIDGAYAVDVVQHITPVDAEAILDALERRLDAMKASRPNRKRKVAIDDIEAFMATLEQGTENAFDVATLFHVHGPERRQVRDEAKRLLHRLRRTGARGKNLRWEQAGAMLDVAPMGVQQLRGRTKRVDTSSIKRAYPWSASALWLEGAVPWGETIDSRRPVGWTPWRRPIIANPHLVVYALSGGGKGFGVKVVTSRLLFAGETRELFGFDQAEEDLELGEYGRWAAYCGLEYRHVKSTADIDAALADLDNYGWLGPGICWNIAQLPLADRPEFLWRTKAAIFKRAAEHPAPRQWVVDELWSFVKGAEALGADPHHVARSNGAIEDLVRRGRHLRLGGAFMTQRPKDSLESQLMQIIQSQASSQWVGMQMPAEITDIAPRLHWTPAEVAAIKRFVPGHGLLVAGPWRVTMRVTASDDEYAMANTDGKVTRDATTPSADGRGLDEDADPGDGGNGWHAGVPEMAVPPRERPAAEAGA